MNFFTRLFQRPQDHFKKLPVNDSRWTVLTWNWDLKNTNERNATLELNDNKSFKVLWNNKELIFFEDKKISAFPHKNSQELKDLFNLTSHLSVKKALESHHAVMRETSEADINAETKSLQWIQASFKTLEGALKKVQGSPEYIFTGAIFSGINPEINQRVLRLICFNLDINYFMLEDGSLRILVFDDKNQGHGSQQTPSFHQIIKLTKPLFYDEMTKLLQLVTSVGEIR